VVSAHRARCGPGWATWLGVTELASTGAIEASEPAILSKGQILVVFSGLLTGSFLAALDQTIVATALPTIVRDLGGASQLSWVVTAYLLTSTIATGLWGRLSDLFGRKRLFQLCILIFLVGSALAGLSQTMWELIAFRALQGIGGGGLMVLSQAIIGDVVPPRDRGRYQGLFGAVFGVASVLGPLIGGFFVDTLSWHWVFYINLPFGIAALIVTSVALPDSSPRLHGHIDYLGATLVGVGVACVVLATSLGGTTFAWNSPFIIGLIVAAVVLLAAFVIVERTAENAILPMRLFRLPVFAISSAISFVVGAAMLGSLTYLPTYLQLVKGASATSSGLQMLPLMAGLLLTSTLSGQLVSRTGHYKIFPIIGSGLMAIGLYLLSTMGVETSTLVVSIYMLVFGLGLGLILQILTVAVQNVVEYEDLGAATSGVSFFRSMGSVIGVAVFGSIFANRLNENLAGATTAPERAEGYANAIHLIFLVAIPVAVLAFVLSWFLKEVPLRTTSTQTNPGATLGITQSVTSAQELERAMSRLMRRENVAELYRRLAAAANLPLSPGATWLLSRIASVREGLEDRRWPDEPNAKLIGWRTELEQAGLVTTGELHLTDAGNDAADRLLIARRASIENLVADWSPEQHQQLIALINSLANHSQGQEDETLVERSA
jgi:EmrB/QacA subfamily drug resistance transporter